MALCLKGKTVATRRPHCQFSRWGQVRHRRRLLLEALEHQWLLSTPFNTIVHKLDNSILDGNLSLCDAIAAATRSQTTDFSVVGTIDLAREEQLISLILTITSPRTVLPTTDTSCLGSHILLRPLNTRMIFISSINLIYPILPTSHFMAHPLLPWSRWTCERLITYVRA